MIPPAAIPFFGLGVWNVELPGLPTIPLDPWALLVCLGFVLGLEVGRARGLRLGMDPKDIVDGAVFIVVSGFVIGHVFTVLAYHPERLQTEGIWAILKVWTGFSSTGGFVGAVIGAVVFYGWLRPRPLLRYLDVIAFGFPFGWVLGRLGCGVVHDHIGKQTTFPLAMDFDHGMYNFTWVSGDPYPWADGIRHELGLYEMVLTVPICLLFLWLGRRDRVPGTFSIAFFLAYAPIRFGLDFLRNDDLSFQDARYASLTPAQWGMIVFFGVCVAAWFRLDRAGFVPWPLDGLPDQAARAEATAAGGLGPEEPVGEGGVDG